MWFMNKILNPLVHLILRSPLHGMMSATLLLVTYAGRKSGKEYTLPVQYVQDERIIYIVPGAPEKKTWWRNFRHSHPVQLWLKGKSVTGEAIVLDGDVEAEEVMRALNLYLQRFPSVAKMREIRFDGDGLFNQEDIRRTASTTIIVRVILNS